MNFKEIFKKFPTLNECLNDLYNKNNKSKEIVLSNEVNNKHCRVFYHVLFDKYIDIYKEIQHNHMYEVRFYN